MKCTYQKIVFLCLLLSSFFVSCKKDTYLLDASAKLKFSSDSVIFDTIFTSIGSSTKYFKIYNQYDETLNISEIKLGKGINSKYRLNINGISANQANNIEILPKDSMYIFVEVTINPNRDKMLENDSIVFVTNGNQQDVKLIAWGQDVHFINGEIIVTQTWSDDKPYLIYNSMLIDENQTLTLKPGTKLYFHKGSRLYVKGTIDAQGTKTKPVVFTSDRLEEMYDDVPGQWNGIWLIKGSGNNKFNYSIIKNAIIGIQADSIADENLPTFTIHNSRVEHHSYAGIYAQTANVLATNTIVGDCGYYSVALLLGGNYEFYHCTIGNYWNPYYSNRNTTSVILNNYFVYKNAAYIRDLKAAFFGNCIIYGNLTNELSYDFYPNKGLSNFLFENCLLKVDEKKHSLSDVSHFINCIVNQTPKFENIDKYDYHLDAQSPAKNKGNIRFVNQYPILLEFDFDGSLRNVDEAPDLGAYESKK